MRLHVELFAEDLPRSRDFYARVLGFEIKKQKPDGYTEMARGQALIGLNARGILHPDHPAYPAPGERVGRAVEIFLTVDDVDAEYQRVVATGWPISTHLTDQPWGLRDFRIVDPDGYYVNVSSPDHG